MPATKPYNISLVPLLGLIFIGGCIASSQTTPNRAQNDAQYTSSFPTQNVSASLRNIQHSLLRLTSTTVYNIYSFEDQHLTIKEIDKVNLEKTASSTNRFDETKAGTAVAILENNRHIAFLTANHILSMPDTLINYSSNTSNPDVKVVKSIGIKAKQFNYLYSNTALFKIDVLATNSADDIALIKTEQSRDSRVASLSLKIGAAQDLKIGSFLYITGFPLGLPMVTRGIVSAPNYDNTGSFLTDALFNHGISGGLIIASRDNFNSFEWVGMAATASASNQYFLVPNPANPNEYKNFEPYNDTAFIEKRDIINYGITQAIPIEKILSFLYRHEDVLRKYGLSSTNLGQ